MRHRRTRRRGRWPAHSLQNRLFLWFGAAILVSVILALTVMRLVSGESGWHQEVERIRGYAADRVAVVWSSPAARDELVGAMASQLDLDIVLRDAAGKVVSSAGQSCTRPVAAIPVVREAKRLGTLEVCATRHHMGRPWAGLLPLAIAVAGLWAASGLMARRLSRPLVHLARVAGEIGRGKLATRVVIGPGAYAEARILGEVVNDMASRIEKQLADQRILLAAVSHEIRSPLARIRLLSEMAREPDSTAKNLDAIDREVAEIDELVSDLLASSRLDFTAVNRTVLDATDIARQQVERMGLDPGKLVVEAPHARFEGDPTLLSRALFNLLDNAEKHGGGVSVFRVALRDGLLVFEVEDTGEGFEPGEEVRIFEPFYRRARGQGEARSVGLGLALVRRIAEAHGGKAYAKNLAGGGACVGVALPAARRDR